MTSTRAILAALLLLAAPLAAQDESLAPDGDEETADFRIGNAADCTAAACNATACDDEVDELPASPDGNIAVTVLDGRSIYFDFPTPSSSPSTTASAQNFDVTISKCNASCVENAGGGEPTYDIAILCAGVLKTTIASAVAVAGSDQNDTSNTWTFASDGDCSADGSTVQVEITSNRGGAGGGTRHVCVEAVEWEVTHAAAGGDELMVIGK